MSRENFRSRLGFILVSAGCAIGIGNVWKFPYVTGVNGGANYKINVDADGHIIQDFTDTSNPNDASSLANVLASLDIMDEARRQAGIVFPADTQAS